MNIRIEFEVGEARYVVERHAIDARTHAGAFVGNSPEALLALAVEDMRRAAGLTTPTPPTTAPREDASDE